MARIALGVEYDGSAYHGWQSQLKDDVPTVQEAVEKALSVVANHKVKVICAGRTDAGVHGTGQVIHFDSDSVRDEKAWVAGTNSNLPKGIALRWARSVGDDFHARFVAHSRRYRYVIYNHRTRPALFNRQVSWDYRTLDITLMQEAARYLVGTHDFSAYRGVSCQAKSPIKTLHHLQLYRQGPMLVLEVEANAFLLHMVRNIAGVLMAVGAGERPPEWAREVLESRDRKQGGVTAPPYGLYMVGVGYPSQFGLPEPEYGPVWLPHDLSDW
ncbi:MAG: tRNA pseudouridine(38-40) synthase TruA [Gammaproteobacteria bacterium]|jgi:tRNA pseudouridine38-40 synthase|nr:tRNA pseudouridine(38-40) synthase TruA [Gammaproteobacteria bacterium]MBQ0774030.1 tRNA pseudouridine(38-40) synthase TruA [Gammaproteobacteria bacterium]|tara:strand:- start:73145 stop:73954 length:810 start_codon:yes stop_codon:yes gene_type:complete